VAGYYYPINDMHPPVFDGTMRAVYRERIIDDRLRAVVDHVRLWLCTKVKKAGRNTIEHPRKSAKVIK